MKNRSANKYRLSSSGVIDAVKSAATYAEADDVWKRVRSYRNASAGTLAKVSAIIARRFPAEFATANMISEG